MGWLIDLAKAAMSEQMPEAYAERYHGPGCAVTAVLPLPKPRAPVNLDEALRAACEGVAGIMPAEFRSLLSPEDMEDIEGGNIPVHTLNAYASSFAGGIRCGRITVLAAAAMLKPAATERVRCNGCQHFERDTMGGKSNGQRKAQTYGDDDALRF